MSDLLKNIDTLLNEVMTSEANTLNIYARLIKAYEGLANEKFVDVAGLNRPNFIAHMTYIRTLMSELENIKFAVESRLHDKDRRELKNKIDRWEESIKKIPLKDEYSLEGIETWHVSHYEMVPDSTDIHSPLFKEEAVKLLASGFDLAINDECGTGSILVTNDGFDIELWQYNKKKVIHKKTLDEVIDWLIYFYDHGQIVRESDVTEIE